ncbi:MAG: isoprenylcysteine carboxylmethyltransferase family protein [Acidobacteriota bacterium]|nr:isoprenylcysteine carboxylmethyltransferase family protein [Acidobacteriota bacterium]
MTIDASLVLALWVVLITYWLVSAALGTKRAVGKRGWSKEIGFRLVFLALAIVLLRHPGVRQALRDAQLRAAGSPILGAIGVACCALGVALALWARIALGRNWGVPMSRKEQPELITTGPYAFARHPIYGGFLLAMAGSAMGASVLFVLVLVPAAVYFLYSAHREEQLMTRQFPDVYPAYRQRTKMLIPFLV